MYIYILLKYDDDNNEYIVYIYSIIRLYRQPRVTKTRF